MMRRRDFITLLGGAAAWPLAAQAQESRRVRRVGVLATVPADDSEIQTRMAAFHQGLQEKGWIVGRNIRIDYRWSAAGDDEQTRKYAAELIALAPEVVLAVATATVGPLKRVSGTTPIVFVQVSDPVGAGFVESLARPGGNTTGFTLFEFSMSAKWLELLKDIEPSLTRVAVLRDPDLASGIGQFAAMQSVAPSLGMELTPIGVRGASEIERALSAVAQRSNTGLVVLPGSLTLLHRKLIITLAAHHHLPAVYPYRYHVTDGGLISYGPDTIDQYRLAAGYVDRILKGEKPAELPVQAATKFELVINLKTAKTLGIEVPPTLLARYTTADEVIE
jgi:putative tryptophan/tyrosine transport system substrate-binding protein